MRPVRRVIGLVAAAVAVAWGAAWIGGSTAAAANDISGMVNGSTGPEASVWVIAETDDLETSFRKIVVTNDEGRFLVPDLPGARGGEPDAGGEGGYHAKGGCADLHGELLVLVAGGAARE